MRIILICRIWNNPYIILVLIVIPYWGVPQIIESWEQIYIQ